MDENEAVVIAVLAVVVAIVLSKLPPTATLQKGKNTLTPKAAIIDYTEPIFSIYRRTNRTTVIKSKLTELAEIITTKITTRDSRRKTARTDKATTTTTIITDIIDDKSTITTTTTTVYSDYQISKQQQQIIFQNTPTTIAIAGYFYQKGRPRPITLTTAIATTTTDEDAADYPRLRELYRRTKHSLVFLLIFEIDFLNFIVL